MAQWLMNPTSNHGVTFLIPDLDLWVKDPALPWAVVQVTDAAQILYFCGIVHQLQLKPYPRNFHVLRVFP